LIEIQVMHDSSEIIFYNTPELPVKIINPRLSDYPGMRVMCHWHEDIELIYIENGEMNYEVNGKTIRLPEHCLLFVNARQLHYGFKADSGDCDFICVLFHPSLLKSSARLFRKAAEPILCNEGIDFLLFEEDDSEDYRAIAGCVRKTAALRKRETPGYEWEVIGLLNRIWSVIFRRCEEIPAVSGNALYEDRQLQRKMVSYIFSHFAERLTLEEIAASGRVSRSKCCLIFKKYLGESPIDFVNSYRLEKSCLELRNTTQSITEIALNCGFNHSSYFTKLFCRKYGCTPSEYRRNAAGPVRR
jgi:AraC-type DNA-binding domain-containing proteins